MGSPWKEAPNGEGSYFDPDEYAKQQVWWTDERTDRMRDFDAKNMNEDGTVKWLGPDEPPSWWNDIHS